MLIKNPDVQVLGFDLIDWLAENEPCPKKEVRSFLRECYEELSRKRAKVEETEEENNDKDKETDGDDQFGAWLLDTIYPRFSLSVNGDILLITDEEENSNGEMRTFMLMLTDSDAKDLLPKLKSHIEERVAKLRSLLK